MRFVRFLPALLAVVVTASACSGDVPEPPPPRVSTVEFEHRLDEHLSRFTSVLDAKVSTPAHSRVPGCTPSWAVKPRSAVTVSAGEKEFDDLQRWVSRLGFQAQGDADSWQHGKSGDFRELTADFGDSTHVVAHLARDAARFTITTTGPCTWPPDHPGAPASGGLTPLRAVPGPTSSGVLTSHAGPQVCLSPKLYVYNTSASAFTGPGPHPMVPSVYSGATVSDPPKFLYDDLLLTSDWWPDDVKQAQLVACIHVSTSGTGHALSCSYTSEPLGRGTGSPYNFKILESTYDITVREARTGTVVGTFSLPGTVPDDLSCPLQLDNYLEPLARGLDEDALTRVLSPLYNGTR